MGARLEEFLDDESELALSQVEVAVVVREAQRALVPEWPEVPAPTTPPPPPEPAPIPVVEFPRISWPPPVIKRLERLKIDRSPPPIVGETCPCCRQRPLHHRTVLWPNGVRPEGGPEGAWYCDWCRQYYVYVVVT